MEGQLWHYKASKPEIVRPEKGYQFSQKQLQEFVGGLFEVTDLDDHYIDNCTRLGLPQGTVLVHHDDRIGLRLNRHIYCKYRLHLFGTVLVCPGRSVARNAEADQMRDNFKKAAHGGLSKRIVRAICQMQVEEELERQEKEKETNVTAKSTSTD
jgi:hypothetical protein